MASISRSFGKHRHWATSVTRNIKLSDMEIDLTSINRELAYSMVNEGASLEKVSEVIGAPVICLVKLLHGSKVASVRISSVVQREGKSEYDLGHQVCQLYTEDISMTQVAKQMRMHPNTCNKLLRIYLRKRLHLNAV